MHTEIWFRTNQLWRKFVGLTDAKSLDKTGSCDYRIYLYTRQVENYRRQHNNSFLFFFCNNIFSSILYNLYTESDDLRQMKTLLSTKVCRIVKVHRCRGCDFILTVNKKNPMKLTRVLSLRGATLSRLKECNGVYCTVVSHLPQRAIGFYQMALFGHHCKILDIKRFSPRS